ncbi:MAG TPA: alpha/beta hydrolase [Actinomycetota bacterium]|nr:alpha/beta hydrolase [Actinomycetota bacterium]
MNVTTSTITDDEEREAEAANESGRAPVVFVHGLWLLPSSWDRWAEFFEHNGYAALTPGWPDDPDTVEEAREHPEVLAGKSIGDIADHFEAVIGMLEKKPVIIGHSTGALLTEILAGRGLAAASVAISPAPSRGVLPLPLSSIRVASTALRNPANRHRAVPLTFDQFRYGFANYVDEDQARRMFEQFCVAAPGEPLFQAAAANLNPWTEAKFDAKNPDRGPMLIIAGGKEHTVPVSVSKASFKREQDNPGTTEFIELADRGHGMVIDDNWQEVAETALKFVGQFIP